MDYDAAIDAFKTAISLPASVVHRVHYDSYKKLFLINLIVYGKPPKIPSHTYSVLNMRLENGFELYQGLYEGFSSKDDKMLAERAVKAKDILEKDTNWGLVCKLLCVHE